MTAMIPLRPLADILSFDRPFNSIFDTAWAGTPRVDLKDAEDHLELVAEVPGMTPEQVEVTVEGGVLTIAAKADEEKSENKDGYVWRERRLQSLQRSFRLPRGTAADQVAATMDNGLLTITVPKPQAPAPTKVAIKGAKAEAEAETPAAS